MAWASATGAATPAKNRFASGWTGLPAAQRLARRRCRGWLEVARRRFPGSFGAQRGYEAFPALVTAGAAFALGGLSLSIYLLQGGRLPSFNPALAFVSPIAIELLIVPLAVGIAWLEFGRFLALRTTPPPRLPV